MARAMADGIFTTSADGLYMPTEHARGPWDPNALHGGAPAALIVRAFERTTPGTELPIARLGFEFLRPIPFAELEVRTEIVRAGRRVQELTAELRTAPAASEDGRDRDGTGAPEGELIGRASALRIQAVPEGLPDPDDRRQRPGPEPVQALPGPEQGQVMRFALNDTEGSSLATTGMEMRWLSDPWP